MATSQSNVRPSIRITKNDLPFIKDERAKKQFSSIFSHTLEEKITSLYQDASIMELITMILVASVMIVAVAVITQRIKKRAAYVRIINKFPGPPTHLILGNAKELMVPRNQIMAKFHERTVKYGPLFRTWMGSMAQVHLTKPEHVELILRDTKHLDKSNVYKLMGPWLGEGLLTGTGAKWHSHRKMITPTFHFKILDTFVDVFVEKSQILLKKLERYEGKEFDIYPFITHCALDIICETAMGVQMNAQEDSRSEYVSSIYEISELTMQRCFRPWLYNPTIFKWSDLGKRYSKCLSVLHGFTKKVIRERQILRNSIANPKINGISNGFSVNGHLLNGKSMNGINGVNKNHENHALDDDIMMGKKKRLAFLDLLLEVSESSDGVRLTDDEIREEVDTFMFEGHDTTTAGLCWALFLLGSHKEVQERVHEELDHIFHGSERSATMRDLNDMKYLERVIKEALRLYPSVPFIGRRAKEDIHIDGYVIPKGCMINLQIFHVHRNPDQFPDPEKFDPDNFLPERVQARHPYSFVPFSAGPRNCIGQKFALLEEKAVLSSILRKYELKSVERREDLVLMSELILRPESGIKLILTPRDDKPLLIMNGNAKHN